MAGMSEKQQPPASVYRDSANNPEDPTSQGYPVGTVTVPNVVTVNLLMPANVGQQYRDQCKSLPSYWLELCILTIWSACTVCSRSAWKEGRVWLMWSYNGSCMSSFGISPQMVSSFYFFFLVSLPNWSYLSLVSSFNYHYPSCLRHPLNLRIDRNYRCSRCGVSLPTSK